MKRIVSFLVVSALILLCASCSGVMPDDADTGRDTGDIPGEQQDTVKVPNERSVTLTSYDLGLVPWFAAGYDPGELSVEITDGNGICITALGPFQGEITVTDVYAQTSSVRIDAGDDLSLRTEVTPPSAGRSVSVADKGAKDGDDITLVLQECIDGISSEGGGTVFVPAGSYTLGSVTVKPGVTLRFSGFPRNAADGYCQEIKDDLENGIYAVIKGNGSSRSNIFIYNTPLPQSYCTEGTSDFTVSGGFFDCESKMKWTATACGRNIMFENAVVKDLPNNHAMQIDGCEDFTVRNVVFAGYRFPEDGKTTRETIQLEPTTPGAITSTVEKSPILNNKGDYHSNRNITVTGCYFGNSDTSGPQLTALGHHGYSGSLVCDGLYFTGNTVDNPLYCGLHLLNTVNVTVSGNTFISDGSAPGATIADDSALISLYGKMEADIYSYDDKDFCHAFSFEHPGTQNYIIENNRFILGGGTPLRAVYIAGVSAEFDNNARYLKSKYYRFEEFGGDYFKIEGYQVLRNTAADITFSENSIEVLSQPSYTDCAVSLFNLKGFFESRTEMKLGDGVSFESSDLGISGFSAPEESVVTDRTRMNTRTVKMSPGAVRDFTVRTAGGFVTVPVPDEAAELTFVSDRGKITLETDVFGNLTLDVITGDGFAFSGWTDASGATADPASPSAPEMTFYAAFTDDQS